MRILHTLKSVCVCVCMANGFVDLYVLSQHLHPQVSAMVELSATQLAELAVASGALAEGSSIVEIMSNLDTNVEALAMFLDQLNTIAAVMTLAENLGRRRSSWPGYVACEIDITS